MEIQLHRIPGGVAMRSLVATPVALVARGKDDDNGQPCEAHPPMLNQYSIECVHARRARIVRATGEGATPEQVVPSHPFPALAMPECQCSSHGGA